MPRALPVVSLLLVFQLMSLSWAQIYSDTDTMSINGATGYAGDTISVPVNMINSFAVGGFQSRLAFDNYTFVADTVFLTSRAQMFDLFGNYLGEPGVASFFGTSLHPIENYIPIGSGDIATLVLTIRNSAMPGPYPIIFEDSDSLTHENALSNIYGDSLIIPIFVSGEIEVLPSASVGGDQAGPQLFEITQNYPNPFNNNTEISFTLDSPQHVRLTVYDILGQKVVELHSGEAPAGRTIAIWDGKDENGKNVNSGIYFYRLEDSGGKSVTKRMTLLK